MKTRFLPDQCSWKEKAEKNSLRIDWCRRSITKSEWEVLEDVIKKYKIKKVVEFGPGVSTQLMDRFGVEVHAYETMLIHIKRIQLLTCNTTYILWDGQAPPIFDEEYDLAFIDGPCGGENREPSYQAIANSGISFVACHDCKREVDSKWIKKYFQNWVKIARADESIPGLLVLRRP